MMNFINRFMRLFRRRTVNIGRDVQLLGNTIIGCVFTTDYYSIFYR